jgi:hypothetical protein
LIQKEEGRWRRKGMEQTGRGSRIDGGKGERRKGEGEAQA